MTEVQTCGFRSTTLVATWVGPLNLNTVIIASLVVLLPGISLTNAVNGLASQHWVSGTARFAGALTTVLKLTVGAVIALPFGIAQAGAALLRIDLLALGAAVALLSSTIPYALELVALRRLPASAFAILMSLGPATASIAGFLLLGGPGLMRLLNLIKEPFVLAFSTASSEAAYPKTLSNLEKFGVPNRITPSCCRWATRSTSTAR